MRRSIILLTVLVCAFSASAQRKQSTIRTAAIEPAGAMRSMLPIRKVVLYSNGVAYIERRGMVSGNAEISLSFKQSQVDDVLKSMVVLDLGKGRIGAVSYNSSAPIESRMAEIPFSVNAVSGDGSGISAVLSQLQGAKVMVNSQKGIIAGSILTIEQKQTKTDKETTRSTILVIASEGGEITSVDTQDVRSVKLMDEGTRKDLNEFANATASARRLDAKTITVTSQGTGEREMVVSYTIAAPIWKTTYRVVLDKAGKPYFQGWAIVDNVSEEDWRNVQLSLVSGSPVSFIQPLQKPFYRHRPIVPTREDLQLRPQVYEPQSSYRPRTGSSISGTVTDANGAVVPGASVTITNTDSGAAFSVRTDADGEYSREGLIGGSYTIRVDAAGFKSSVITNVQAGTDVNVRLEVGGVSEVVTVSGREVADMTISSRSASSLLALSPGTSVSDALLNNNSGVQTAAVGEEIGDLFEYRIEQPVTVNRDRSALIPILQTTLEGERVSVYNETVRQDRPFSGVLLKNTTALTLESGSMTVLDGDAYAGEAMMERLKPKEERLISFALDLGTNVQVRQAGTREPVKLVKVSNGVFEAHYFQGESKTYRFSNQSDKPKIVYVEYPIRDGWELSDRSPKPDYVTQRFYRFRVELKAFDEKELTISLRQPLMDSYQLASLSRDDLKLFVTRNYIDEATRQKLDRLITLRSNIVEIETKLRFFIEEVSKITVDQKRLRENIESLAKTPEAKVLIARYIAKANDQETRLEQLEKDRQAMASEKEKLEGELAAEIRNFQITGP